MTSAITVTEKKAMRAAAIARRSTIPPAERIAGAARIAAQGLLFATVPPPAVVSAFLAIGEEIDPAPLLAVLQGEGYRPALPVMVAKAQPLMFRAWSPGDPLRTVQWGIREPEEGAPAVQPDLLLVPLLAFDRSGHRLGYGGGYFDRTLAQLRAAKPIVAIGLAFSAQEVDDVPHLDYDQRLDWVLTPEGPIRCSP